jgi:hypothetical protein
MAKFAVSTLSGCGYFLFMGGADEPLMGQMSVETYG